MSTSRPLDENEELFWRSLIRLVISVPRHLGDEFERAAGVTETEFSVLTQLSEAPEYRLRMADLAERTALSASRISRVIDLLGRRGLVTKRPSPNDARMLFANLTPEGLETRERLEPEHVRTVRGTLFDYLTAVQVRSVGPVLEQLAEAIGPISHSGGTE